MSLIDDEDDSTLENIAETLSEDNDVLAVRREEVSAESQVNDEVKSAVESEDAELVGRFNQLNIVEHTQ